VKRTQWGKKNVVSVIIIIILSIAVFFDQTYDDINTTPSSTNKPSSTLGLIPKNVYEAKLAKNQQIIDSEDIIHNDYADIAIPYAMAMAELKTFKYDAEINRSIAEKFIRQQIPSDGSVIIEELTINNEVVEGQDHQYLAMIKLKIFTHKSALSVLDVFGKHKHGIAWDSFSLLAHHKKKNFTLSGNLKILFIAPVE